MLISSTSFVDEEINMVKGNLFSPPGFRRFLRDLGSLLSRKAFRARIAAHPAQCHGGGVLAVVGGHVVDLAGGNSGDHHGVPDGIGGTLLAFRASGHSNSIWAMVERQ